MENKNSLEELFTQGDAVISVRIFDERMSPSRGFC